MHMSRFAPTRRRLRLLVLSLTATATVVLGGCSYSRILRDRLPTPHRVDDFEHAVR